MLKEVEELLDAAGPSDYLGVAVAWVTLTVHLCAEEPAIATRHAVRALKRSDALEEYLPESRLRGLSCSLDSYPIDWVVVSDLQLIAGATRQRECRPRC